MSCFLWTTVYLYIGLGPLYDVEWLKNSRLTTTAARCKLQPLCLSLIGHSRLSVHVKSKSKEEYSC